MDRINSAGKPANPSINVAALAAMVETTFRTVAAHSWQQQHVGKIAVVPSELALPNAFLANPQAVNEVADITLNFDWLDTVYRTGLTRVDRCLTLAAMNPAKVPWSPGITVVNVTLLRVGAPHYNYGNECTERGIAAFAGDRIGYWLCDGDDYERRPADVDGAVNDLLVKLHHSRIHDFDFPGCFYSRRQARVAAC